MDNAPTHLLTDPDQRDVTAWNAWRGDHPEVPVELANADLAGAYLVGVDLNQADIDAADFTGANLTGALLTGARANWTKFDGADLTGADLVAAVMSEPSFTGATLDRADCRHSKLRFSRFTDISAVDAVLLRADLTGSVFRGTSRIVDLSGANMGGAFLVNARVYRANLAGVRLAGVRMHGTELADVDFISADLSGAEIDGLKIGPGVCFDDTTCHRVRGGVPGVIVGSVPVGDGSHTSARRNSDGTVTIWSDCDTETTAEACNEFGSFDDYVAAAEAEGGLWIAAKRAWAKFAEANLTPAEFEALDSDATVEDAS